MITGPRRSQLRRDVAFAGSLTVRTLLVVAGSGAIGLLMWTLLPLVAGYSPNVVTSDSMAPTIRAGDVVLTRSIERRDVRPGQVVLLDDADRDEPLLHRVRRIEGGEVVTQGDANPTPDAAPSGPVEVMGVGEVLVPGIGRAALLLHDHTQVAVVVSGLAAVVAGRWSMRPWVRRRT